MYGVMRRTMRSSDEAPVKLDEGVRAGSRCHRSSPGRLEGK